MNSRHVELRATRKGRTVLTVTGPQTRGIYPPGAFSSPAESQVLILCHRIRMAVRPRRRCSFYRTTCDDRGRLGFVFPSRSLDLELTKFLRKGPPIDAAAQANLLANTKPLYR